MAQIIDGSSIKGYFKITPDASVPTSYYQIPKNMVILEVTGADTSRIHIPTTIGSTQIAALTDAAVDEFGNALDTPAKVSQYISDNR